MAMKIEVEIVSKETIVPSSPTPPHLFHYKLSPIDQTTYPVYSPLVLFYSSPSSETLNPIIDLSGRLKTSLSETLTRFYPLAGRLRGNVSVECNDQGCVYIETRVNSPLVDYAIEDPHNLRKFIPFELHHGRMGDFILGIQFNVFECGSVAIGVCFPHKLGDAFSTFFFTNVWARICRGGGDDVGDVPDPTFVSISGNNYYEEVSLSPGFDPRLPPFDLEGCVTKRFVFKSAKINAIKDKYKKLLNPGERPPSRVEALTAFIWTRFITSTDQIRPEKTYVVSNAVNLRPKLSLPAGHYFGNLYVLAATVLSPEDGEFPELIPKMRETASKIDVEFVKEHKNGRSYLNSLLHGTLDVTHLAFTSLCRFPMYETDFGWGKPVRVGFPAWVYRNLVIFTDTPSGDDDGIEAYVTFSKEDMAKFENDDVFRAFI